MGRLPNQRTELHDGDEAAEVLHLLSLILTVHHTGQVEQLGPLIEQSQNTHVIVLMFLCMSRGGTLSGKAALMSCSPGRPPSRSDV